MITEQNYQKLAEEVYDLDPLKYPDFKDQVKLNDEIESQVKPSSS